MEENSGKTKNEQQKPAGQEALDRAPIQHEPAAQESTDQKPEDQETKVANQAEPFEVAVLPLQNTTLFPGTVVPLSVGRERSVAAVEAALATEEKFIACFSARSGDTTGEDAKPSDLYQVGTLATIKRMMRNEDTIDRKSVV